MVAPVVQTLDCAIHVPDKSSIVETNCAIQWIEIYLVGTIQSAF